jgi:hypothetical protein
LRAIQAAGWRVFQPDSEAATTAVDGTSPSG